MEEQTAKTQDCKTPASLADVAPISKLIFSVTKQMRRVFEQQARLQDMTLPQWRALGQLVESNGLSQAALATLIERLPDPADSRAKIVRATPPVTEMVEAMKAVSAELHETMLEGISEADKDVLVRTLNTISDNLAGQSDRHKDVDK